MSSAFHSFELYPIVGDALEVLRRSLVFFHGQPLGTIAAFDHASEEVLNYNQRTYSLLRAPCHSPPNPDAAPPPPLRTTQPYAPLYPIPYAVPTVG
ncbi:hypothetical protein ABZP36_036038 [Zizania latifolia]